MHYFDEVFNEPFLDVAKPEKRSKWRLVSGSLIFSKLRNVCFVDLKPSGIDHAVDVLNLPLENVALVHPEHDGNVR